MASTSPHTTFSPCRATLGSRGVENERARTLWEVRQQYAPRSVGLPRRRRPICPSNPRRQRRSTCRVWSPSCCSQPSTRCRCHTSYACYLRGSASGGKLKGNRSPRDPCSYLSSARYLHALLASLLHDVVDATADFITPALLSGRHPRPSYQRALPTPGMNVGPLPRSRVACGRPHRDGDYVL